jgi:hypothetical protein
LRSARSKVAIFFMNWSLAEASFLGIMTLVRGWQPLRYELSCR